MVQHRAQVTQNINPSSCSVNSKCLQTSIEPPDATNDGFVDSRFHRFVVSWFRRLVLFRGFSVDVSRYLGFPVLCTRGGSFCAVGAGVDVTVRQRLFESLVRQEIGFFDTRKTGDLMSLLAGDCTKIGDQVMNNVNVFLRWVVRCRYFRFFAHARLQHA